MAFNIGAFPLDSVMFSSYTRLFQAGQNVAMAAMPALIMGRALWGMISAKRGSEQLEIIKDAFFALIMLASFLSFLRILMDIPSILSSLFEDQGTYSLKLSDKEAPLWNDIVNYVTIFCFWISAVFYAVALVVVSSVAAYIIAFGTMFRSYILIKATAWLLLLISCWPLVWYALNMAIKNLSQDDGFVNGIIVTTLNILKALSPLFATFLAMKSPLGKIPAQGAGMLKSALGGATGAASSLVSKLGGQSVLDQFNSKKQKVTEGIGSTLSKTIPTMGLAAGTLGSAATSLFKRKTPEALKKPISSAMNGASSLKRPFANSTNPYTGKTRPDSSPFMKSLRATSKLLSQSNSSLPAPGSKTPQSPTEKLSLTKSGPSSDQIKTSQNTLDAKPVHSFAPKNQNKVARENPPPSQRKISNSKKEQRTHESFQFKGKIATNNKIRTKS